MFDVRNGNALAEPGGTIFLALDQRLDDFIDRRFREGSGLGQCRDQFPQDGIAIGRLELSDDRITHHEFTEFHKSLLLSSKGVR